MIELTQLQVNVAAKGIDKTNSQLEKLATNSDKAEGSTNKLKGTLSTLDTIQKSLAGATRMLSDSMRGLASVMKENEGTFKSIAGSAQQYAGAIAIVDKAAAKNLINTERQLAAIARKAAADEAAAAATIRRENAQRIADDAREASAKRQLALDNAVMASESRQAKAATDNLAATQRLATATANREKAEYRLAQAKKFANTQDAESAKLQREQRFQMLTLQYTVNDVIASMASGANPMTVLMQQGGQVTQAFDGLGNTMKKLPSIIGGFVVGGLKALLTVLTSTVGMIASVGAVIVGYGVNVVMAAKQQAQFNNEVFLSGNALGITYDRYRELSDTLANDLNISISEAKDRFNSFAEAGKYSAQEVVGLTEVTSRWAKLSGKDFDEVQKKVAQLAEEPAKLALAVGNVDLATIKYIQTLQMQGRESEALKVALASVNKELDQGTKQATERSMGYLETYYTWVFGLFKKLGQAISNFFHNWGRDATEGEKALEMATKVRKAQADIAILENAKKNADDGGPRFSGFQEMELKRLKRELELEQENLKHLNASITAKNANAEADRRANVAKEETAALNDRYLKAGKDIVGVETAKANALARYTAQLDKMGVKANDGSEAAKQAKAFYDAEIKSIDGKTKAKKEEKYSIDALMKSSAQAIENSKEAIFQGEKQSALEKQIVAIQYELDNSVKKMNASQRLALETRKQELIVQNQVEESVLSHTEAIKQWTAANEAAIAKGNERNNALDVSLEKMKMQVWGLNEVASAVTRVSLAEAERRKAAAEQTLRTSTDPKKTGEASGILETVGPEIERLKELLKFQELDEAMAKFKQLGTMIGDALSDGFGQAGKALGTLVKGFTNYTVAQQQIISMEEERKKLADGSAKAKNLDLAITERKTQSEREMYGSMISGAKLFFKEGSKGYKALQKIEMAYKLASIAMDVKKMASESAVTATSVAGAMARGAANAVAAIASAFSAPWPVGIAMGAGMIVLMSSLGLFSGGGGNFNSAAQNQEAAGKGSVFGDPEAKSESISKSLDLVAKNSEISATYQRGMLKSLQNIEKALAGTAKQILKSDVVGQATENVQVGFKQDFTGKFVEGLLGSLFDKTGMSVIGKFVGKLFGSKVSLMDTGIKGTGQNVAQILKDGFQGLTYATIETKKKFLGVTTSKKVTQQTGDLNTEVEQQFTLVIQSLAQGVVEAGKLLGKGESEVMAALNSMVVDFGEMSLQGLKGAEIEEQLGVIFSKLGDDMAKRALPGFEQFQEIGEGYFETIVRVASSVATIDGIFTTLGADLGVVFKATGMAAIEAKMDLIDMVGGLEALSEKVSFFFDKFYSDAEKLDIVSKQVSSALADLGVKMPETRQEFRNYVNSLNLADAAQRELWNSLMELAPAIDQILPPFEKTKTAAEEAADALAILNSELDAMKNAAQKALSGLERSINAEKDSLKKQLDERIAALNAEKELLKTNYEARKGDLEKEAEAAANAAEAQAQAAEEAASRYRAIADNLKAVFDALQSGIDQLRGSVAEVVNANYQAAKRDLVAMVGAARNGQLPTADAVGAITGVLGGNSADNYASAQDFAREQLVAANYLEEIQGYVGTQMSDAERMAVAMEQSVQAIRDGAASTSAFYQSELEALEKQYNLDVAAIDKQIEDAQKKYDSDVAYLDGILANAKMQLEIAMGTYEAILSVHDALVAFNSILASLVMKQEEVKAAELEAERMKTTSTTQSAATTKSDEAAVVLDDVVNKLDVATETIQAGNRAIAQNTLETAKVLRRWDGDGQPDVRAE